MRLIDADSINPADVIGGASEFATDIRKAMQDLIDIQPTAYDLDKVVEQLENEKSGLTTWAEDEAYKLGIEKAIELIRSDGTVDKAQEESGMTENKALDNIISMKTEIEYESSDAKQMKRIKCDSLNVAIKALEEIQQYRDLGTVEECREARERQQAKRPNVKIQKDDLKIGHLTIGAGSKAYWCSSCEKAITRADGYCRICGQAIDWSEVK
ncbi:MAG: hypothetical protein K2N01_13295 [Lachnospiraceae bacterium]|nr:hypothetical protein [Lachnospiraceae bacterium]